MFYFTARKIEEAPGHKLQSVGGQHEKQALGLVPAQVPSVKCARLRLLLFFRTLLGTDPAWPAVGCVLMDLVLGFC